MLEPGAEVRVAPVAVVEPVFPLHHHAEVLVVEQQHLDRQLLGVGGGELLDVHQEAAVTLQADDALVRPPEGQSQRMRGIEPHRSDGEIVERALAERPRARWLRIAVPAFALAAAFAIAVPLLRTPPAAPQPANADAFEMLASDDSLALYEDLEFYAWLDAEQQDDDAGG